MNAWKYTKEKKKLADREKEKAVKVSSIMATEDVVPEPIFYGLNISKNQMEFEVGKLDSQ